MGRMRTNTQASWLAPLCNLQHCWTFNNAVACGPQSSWSNHDILGDSSYSSLYDRTCSNGIDVILVGTCSDGDDDDDADNNDVCNGHDGVFCKQVEINSQVDHYIVDSINRKFSMHWIPLLPDKANSQLSVKQRFKTRILGGRHLKE
jgi:hypothetical protein